MVQEILHCLTNLPTTVEPCHNVVFGSMIQHSNISELKTITLSPPFTSVWFKETYTWLYTDCLSTQIGFSIGQYHVGLIT